MVVKCLQQGQEELLQVELDMVYWYIRYTKACTVSFVWIHIRVSRLNFGIGGHLSVPEWATGWRSRTLLADPLMHSQPKRDLGAPRHTNQFGAWSKRLSSTLHLQRTNVRYLQREAQEVQPLSALILSIMYAFVQNLGLSATRASTLPQNGLTNVCGTTLRSAPAAVPGPSPAANVRMTGDYGITLQTLIYTPNPVISGVEDKDTMCYMVWKQVFGNAYVMESERAEAYIAESMYRAGRITVKEFVRGVALSSTYRRRFFECCGPYRAVELNFKHLLGRGPNSQQEASEHIQRIANEGFEAEINSYIDSPEYEEAFGDDFAPYMRFKGTYRTAEEFNRMCTMYSSPGTTDKSLTGRAKAIGVENPNHVLSLDGAGIPSKLVSMVALNGRCAFVKVKKAIPGRPDLDLGAGVSAFTSAAAAPLNENAAPVNRVEISMGNYMYLTAAEAAERIVANIEQNKVVSYAQKETADAKARIAELEAKIEELSLVQ